MFRSLFGSLAIFSPSLSLSLSLSLPVCSFSCTFEIVELKKGKEKNGEIKTGFSTVRDVGYPNRCYLNSFLMMLNHPIDLVRVSEIALQSFFLDVRRLVADLVAPFPLEFEKKKKKKNWNNERIIGGRFRYSRYA